MFVVKGGWFFVDGSLVLFVFVRMFRVFEVFWECLVMCYWIVSVFCVGIWELLIIVFDCFFDCYFLI